MNHEYYKFDECLTLSLFVRLVKFVIITTKRLLFLLNHEYYKFNECLTWSLFVRLVKFVVKL